MKGSVAVVGTGFIGPVHVEALRRLGIPVRGVLGSNPQKSSKAASDMGLQFGYDSYQELLADQEVKVVHLTSPNRFHLQQVLDALAAGKHVICEKPLGMTTQETKKLVAAAKKHPKLITAVNYNIRFYPLILQAREMLRAGELGEIFHVRGAYVQDWLLYPTDFNWRINAKDGGDLRAVGDIGTHWLDLISFITGQEVEAVMSDMKTVHPIRFVPPAGSAETFSKKTTKKPKTTPARVTTEDFANILLRFKNGTRGVLTVSQVVAGRKNRIEFEIAGAKRALAWNCEHHEELWIGERDQANKILLRNPSQMTGAASHHSNYPAGHAEGFPDTFKQMYRAVYADIAAGKRSAKPLYATFEDGHKELALCEAILKSSQTGRWTNVKY